MELYNAKMQSKCYCEGSDQILARNMQPISFPFLMERFGCYNFARNLACLFHFFCFHQDHFVTVTRATS
jgi:hypothetical protein